MYQAVRETPRTKEKEEEEENTVNNSRYERTRREIRVHAARQNPDLWSRIWWEQRLVDWLLRR